MANLVRSWFSRLTKAFRKPIMAAAPAPPTGDPDKGWYPVKALREALSKPGSAGSLFSAEDHGYRRLSSHQDDRRDLEPVKWDWQHRLANWFWACHPVAKKCIQNHRNFICGTGFRLQALAEDEETRNKVQECLDKWWSLNEWDNELSRRVETLSVEGEWHYYCPPANPFTGHWQMCKIMPEEIKEVTRRRINAEQLDAVVLNEPLRCHENGETKELSFFSIIRRCFHSEKLIGNLLHLAINRLSGQTRGFSDLLAVLDHLDLFDTVLFTEAERVQIQRAIVYDVELSGNDQKKIEERKAELEQEGPPRPGSLNVRGPNEKWTILAPQLQISEAIEFCRFLLSLSLGGMHNPEHWFAEGGDVNKATAGEMGGPAFAHVRERKREIQTFMHRGGELALQRYQEVGVLPASLSKKDLAFQVVSRDPEQSAYQAIGAVLQAVGQGLLIGQTQGWFTAAEAARAYRQAATHCGLGEFPGIPDAETLDQAKQQVADRMAAMPELHQNKPLALSKAA